MLDRQIKVLKSEGIHRIILIGGYRSEMLCREDAELRINPAYSETNMVYTLFCAESDLDDEAIVSYGDIVYSRAILSKLLKSDADIAVTIDEDWKSYWFARSNNPLDDAETLKLSSDDRIIEIGQKPDAIEEVESDNSIRVMVLTGSGRVFCAGGDLDQLQGGSQSAGWVSENTDDIRRLYKIAR